MPYANIESRRKYQRDAYQKKKLEYADQRIRLNENETNKLYNELVKQRLKEKAEYQFKPDEDLKNEITKELKPISQYKKYEWLKNQLTGLKDMADFSFTIDTDELKRDERYKKIDDLKTQLRKMELRTEDNPYIINDNLDFLTFMSKYKTDDGIYYLAPITTKFLSTFAPEYWNECAKTDFMPLNIFKKCMF